MWQITLVSSYIASSENLAGFIVIDFNHFKKINDTWGHLYGDEVLRKVARQLDLYFGSNDVVSRLGGDEFAVFCPNISTENDLIEKAKLVSTVLAEIQIGPQAESLSASVGTSIYPENPSYDTLYENSDLAMYVMKKGLSKVL